MDEKTRTSLSRRSLLKGAAATGIAGGAVLAGARSSTFAAPALRISATRPGYQVSGKVTLAYLGTADQAAVWNNLFALFQEKYPDIELEAQANPVNDWAAFFDAISTQIAGGKVPDVVQVATEGQRLFASRGLCEPINDLIDRDKAELADYFEDIHPKLIEWDQTYNTTKDGSRYYLPGDFNTMGYWYNSEVFTTNGIDEPTDDWTWDQVLAAGEALKAKGIYAINVTPEYFISVMPWLLTNGASTLSADWTTATVNTPEAIEAATFMRTLVEKEYSPLPGGTFDQFTATAQGKMAAFGGGRWPIINMRNLKVVDKMKIVHWPQKKQKGSPVGWGAYPIMKGTKNKEAAWTFLKFLASKEASVYFAEQGGTIVPGRKSVANSDSYLANAPEGSLKLYDALEYATPIPSPDKGNVVQSAIQDAFLQVLTGAVEPEEGLNALNDEIQSNL
ncbi:MAG TPA: sugar ABC transporter substrate-binding protein [Thermomicrobiales bacterium]|nr:sugar ABC transporter substrate-binding protein [Thermomicrobiales bacterium]